jgi:hypothetical protein
MMEIQTRKTPSYLDLTNGNDFWTTRSKGRDDAECFPSLLIPHTVIPKQIFFNQVGDG